MKINRLHRSVSHRLKTSARFARALSESGFGRLWLFARVFTLPRNGRTPRRLACRYHGRNFTVHLFSYREINPFLEVFAAGDYGGDWRECRTIVDVGANIGAASLFFWLHAPEARIIAIEPNEANLQRQRLNHAQVPGAVIIQKALAGQRGRVTFFRADGFSLGCSLVEKRPGFIEDTVEAMTLDDLFEAMEVDGVDLCKFDIEGAEFDLFSRCGDTARLRQFIGEFHEDLAHQPVADFLRLFPGHATQSVEIAPQRFICRGVVGATRQAA